MAALDQKFGIIDTGDARDLNQAFNNVWDLVTENFVCGFHLHCNGFDDSPELKAKQEQATAAEIERFYKKAKEILALNHELFEAIAKELSVKGVLTASDIERLRFICPSVPVTI